MPDSDGQIDRAKLILNSDLVLGEHADNNNKPIQFNGSTKDMYTHPWRLHISGNDDIASFIPKLSTIVYPVVPHAASTMNPNTGVR